MKRIYNALLSISFVVSAATAQAAATVYCPPASAIHCDYYKCSLDASYQTTWTVGDVMGIPMANDQFTFDIVYGSTALSCQYNSFNTQNIIHLNSVVSLRPDLTIANQWHHSPDDFDYCGDDGVSLESCPMVAFPVK